MVLGAVPDAMTDDLEVLADFSAEDFNRARAWLDDVGQALKRRTLASAQNPKTPLFCKINKFKLSNLLKKMQDNSSGQSGLKKQKSAFGRSGYGFPAQLKAMLKKEGLVWKANLKLRMLEIAVPLFIFLFMAMVHWSVPMESKPYNNTIPHFAQAPMAYPLPGRGKHLWGNNSEVAPFDVFTQQREFLELYNFANYTEPWMTMYSSMFLFFRGDNCKKSHLNKARERWAIIGHPLKQPILKEMKEDVQDFLTFKKNRNKHKQVMKDLFKNVSLTTEKYEQQVNNMQDPVQQPQPMEFRTEQQFLDYLNHPRYELDDNRPGICYAIQIEDNLQDQNRERTKIKVRYHTEMVFGKTPTTFGGNDKQTSQQMMVTTAGNPRNLFKDRMDIGQAELHFKQGYSFIQNWVANAALRVMTEKNDAQITNSFVPMFPETFIVNEFHQVFDGIFSYLQVMIYLLPIYSTVLRLQQEKNQGLARHLCILGLSKKAQMIALLSSHMVQILLITTSLLALFSVTDLFTKSLATCPELLFLYFWAQGVASFGFILMMSALLPSKMHPKMAATWATLIYFGTTYADFTINKHGIAEVKKIIMAMLFPTLASARAGQILVAFEFKHQGMGLTWESLDMSHQNFRISVYFWIMLFAFISQSTVGILFSYYGSLPEIYAAAHGLVFGKGDSVMKKSGLVKPEKQDPAKFEQRQLSEEGDLLRIDDLVKVFELQADSQSDESRASYFCAVNHLQLELKRGEIFAFLGHNGAGKTTTISMLTGMLEPSQGKITCFGSDISCHLEQYRELLGVCPQYDILFEQLTVMENLDIFCDFKRVSSKAERIEKIIQDIDLVKFKDTAAENLSGGNRRKLSVALALVANSQVVFLDEPTSGMDLSARRRLWNMLNEYKRDRVIILTTHNMDEADLLGDTIGIMNKGRIECLGSSPFLKSLYNQRYVIKIQTDLRNDQAKTASALKDHVQSRIGDGSSGWKLNEVDPGSFEVHIPLAHRDLVPALLETFEDAQVKENLNLLSYSADITTLEDVFFEVGHQDVSKGKEILPEDFNFPITTNELSACIDKYRARKPIASTLLRQFEVLVIRHFKSISRSWRSFAFEIMVPVVLIALGTAFSKFQFDSTLTERELTYDLIRPYQRILVNSHSHLDTLQMNEDFDDDLVDEDRTASQLLPHQIMANLPGVNEKGILLDYYDHDQITEAHLQRDEAYKQYLTDQAEANSTQKAQLNSYRTKLGYNSSKTFSAVRKHLHDYGMDPKPIEGASKYDSYEHLFASYFIYEANNDTKQFKVHTHLNATFMDTTALYPHLLYTAILRTATGEPNLQFDYTNVPFPSNPRTKEYPFVASGLFLCFVAGVGLALIPAAIISKIVIEKETGLRHIQMVSGVRLRSYWAGFYVYDLIKVYMIVALLFLVLWFMKVDKVWIIMHTLLLLPPAVVPYSYVCSFIFEKEITAQTFTIYLNFLASGIFGMIIFALRMVWQTAYFGDCLTVVFRFLNPAYNVCESFILSSMLDEIVNRRRTIHDELNRNKAWLRPWELKQNDVFSIKMTGGNFLALVIHAVMWWVIFYAIEQGHMEKIMRYFSSKEEKSATKLHPEDDVKEEEERIARARDDQNIIVKVDQFRKVYEAPLTKPVVAVEKVSFGVGPGECFALLGVNGAGKSTTFKSLTNIVKPSSGSVKILGREVSQDFEIIRHRIGYCPQNHALFPTLTVLEHLEFFAEIKEIPDIFHARMINEVIKRLGLSQYAQNQAHELSGGNKRKLQVAMAILGNPSVILLDEPSSGMDPGARKFMWKVVKGIASGQSCVVLTTHQMEEAEQLASKMGIMTLGGKFTCFGSVDHVKEKYGSGLELSVKQTTSEEAIAKAAKKLAVDPSKIMEVEFMTKEAEKVGLIQSEEASSELTKFIAQGACSERAELSGRQFCRHLLSYNQRRALLDYLKDNNPSWADCSIIEQYSDLYVKYRAPKQGASVAQVIQLTETFLAREASSSTGSRIEEFHAGETSLEAIFQNRVKTQKQLSNSLSSDQGPEGGTRGKANNG